MAYDDRRDDRPRPQRLGDRDWGRPGDDPEYGMERYGPGRARGYGASAASGDPDSLFGAPGYDAGFGGPRFDRVDVGSTGTHGVHPVSSPYGADYRGTFGDIGGSLSSARLYAEAERGGRGSDPGYAEWRRRRTEELDRDYDEYCREHQARFDEEFGAWREQRGRQGREIGRVREHMEVVGSDGGHVGTVDCTRGDSIVLTKGDPNSGGHHHRIPCGWIDKVDDKVRLNLAADEAMERWRHEDRSRALFEREDSGERGPHILNRSFSGTYRDPRDDD